MVYAALDYYNQAKIIPAQTDKPADHTPLSDYFFLRWKDAAFSNGDKWGELFVNPFGWRTGEFFNWGLQSTGGGRIQELKLGINNGQPISLGLFREGSGGTAPHHVVLAIGYNMGSYSGDLNDNKANKESFRIYVYNPNSHDKVDVLRPNVNGNFYYLESDPSAHYTTYFVDSKYRVKMPPDIR